MMILMIVIMVVVMEREREKIEKKTKGLLTCPIAGRWFFPECCMSTR